MKRHAMIAAALDSLLAPGVVLTPVQTVDAADKEKCYDVVKAGQNDRASPGSAHACVGQPKVDKNPMLWKYVSASICAQMGGMMQPTSK